MVLSPHPPTTLLSTHQKIYWRIHLHKQQTRFHCSIDLHILFTTQLSGTHLLLDLYTSIYLHYSIHRHTTILPNHQQIYHQTYLLDQSTCTFYHPIARTLTTGPIYTHVPPIQLSTTLLPNHQCIVHWIYLRKHTSTIHPPTRIHSHQLQTSTLAHLEDTLLCFRKAIHLSLQLQPLLSHEPLHSNRYNTIYIPL